MSINYDTISREDLPSQIAESIREAILSGALIVGERLPGETELADRFGVSRATVREGLKRLAAQRLIRTQRGPAGGAFVNRLSRADAQEDLVTTARLLISMDDLSFEEAAEARFAVEAACLPFAAERRTTAQLQTLREEHDLQGDPALSDEDFCASDVRFHQTVAEASGNALLIVQAAAVIEAIEPLMNMLTYRMRERGVITGHHAALADALEAGDADAARAELDALAAYTGALAAKRRAPRPD